MHCDISFKPIDRSVTLIRSSAAQECGRIDDDPDDDDDYDGKGKRQKKPVRVQYIGNTLGSIHG
jgi:hypothetical protein